MKIFRHTFPHNSLFGKVNFILVCFLFTFSFITLIKVQAKNINKKASVCVSLNLGTGNGYGLLSNCGLSENVSYCINISGTFTIDQKFVFSNSTFTMSPGSEIIVNGRFGLINCYLEGTNKLWKGISLNTFASILLDNTEIRDAQYGLKLGIQNVLRIYNSRFINNYIGIYGPLNESNYVTTLYFAANVFKTEIGSTLKPHYIYHDQSTYTANGKGYAGIYLLSFSLFEIGKIQKQTGDRNHFTNLNNGIIFYDSNVYIYNTDFSYIFSSQNSTTVPWGYGIFSNSNDFPTYTTLEIVGNKPDFTFKNVLHPIKCKDTEIVNVKDCDFYSSALSAVGQPSGFTQSEIGIETQNLNTFDLTFNILENIFFNMKIAIQCNDLQFSQSQTRNLIQNDTITTGTGLPTSAASSRGIGIYNTPPGPGPDLPIGKGGVDILDNTIAHVPSANGQNLSGINMIFSSRNNFLHNTISASGSHWFNFQGVYDSGGFNDRINNNTIDGQNPNYSGNGIFAFTQRLLEISCNHLYNTGNGLYFLTHNPFTNINNNYFHNHGIAFHLGTNAVLDPAEENINKGNQWLSSNCNSCIDAKNDNENPMAVDASRFWVPDINDLKPENADPLWIIVDKTLTAPLDVCPFPYSPFIGWGDQNDEFVKYFTSTNNGSNEDIDGKLFQDRWQILSTYKSDSTLFQNNDNILEWVGSQNNTNLNRLLNIYLLKSSLGMRDTIFVRSKIVDSLIQIQNENYFYYESEIQSADSLTTISHIASMISINEALLNIKSERYYLKRDFFSRRLADQQNLLAELRDITPISVSEQYLDTLLIIYLKTVSLGVDTFSALELSVIEDIATICTDEGGPATQLARAMLYRINLLGDLPDEPECVLRSKLFLPSKTNSINVEIYPNPINNYLVIDNHSDEISSYKIYNSNGKIITTGNIFDRSNVKLNTSDFNNGFYIIEFLSETGSRRTLKFIK